MLFVQKGYCRYAGKKCRYLKVTDGIGYCKARKWREGYYTIRNKNNNPKNISSDKNVNIKAPWWCPKL